MPTVLRYGVDRAVELGTGGNAAVVARGEPRAPALSDVAAAVHAALAAPLDYPPLARATTPGDRITLAVEAGLPQSAAIVTAVIDYLRAAGVGLDGITVLHTPSDGQAASEALARAWPSDWQQQITRLVHDPADARQMAHLARDTDGDPIFLNRMLTDADVVLPIGLLCDARTAGYFGVHTGLFPTFSHSKAREAFCSLEAFDESGKRHRHLLQEVSQVAWLLGAMFTIQVLPGGGERVLGVLAGDPAAVGVAGRQAYQTAWQAPLDATAGLVVAGIEGDAGQQTWQSFARALAAAMTLVDSGGAIALCCDLKSALGPALQSLCDVAAPHDALQRIARRHFEDFLPARELVRALDANRVYLLSGLEPAVVEQLGMIPLAGTDELLRLVRRHDQCIVLHNAPHACIAPAEEA